ncbi:MAG: penicillin-binding transpeptidase domain-containing protein, partial [Aeromonas sp.]
AALAELMGIIQNGGIRAPTQRIEYLSFAKGTPFATVFEPANVQGSRVMAPEVAQALRNALSKVVEGGTARRIAGAFALPNGTILPMGGKTGTGDNRLETVGRYGNVTSSLARNRTATFVFYIGDDHFGTLTAYVPGSQSDKFRFTSALPVQVLKGMAPLLMPYLEPGTHTQCMAGS